MFERYRKVYITVGIISILLLCLWGIWSLAGNLVDATPKIEEAEEITIPYRLPEVSDDNTDEYQKMKVGNLIYSAQRMFEQMGYDTADEEIYVSNPTDNQIKLTYKSWIFIFEGGGLSQCIKTIEPTEQELDYMGYRYERIGDNWVWTLGEQ